MNKTLATCHVCGHSTVYLHCKVRCFNCGHFLDCSDLEIPGGEVESPEPSTDAPREPTEEALHGPDANGK